MGNEGHWILIRTETFFKALADVMQRIRRVGRGTGCPSNLSEHSCFGMSVTQVGAEQSAASDVVGLMQPVQYQKIRKLSVNY